MPLPFENRKYEVLVKRESETDLKCGIDPAKRDMESLIRLGYVNLDKPSGPTSTIAVNYLKEIMHVKKAGHSGTLDPKVTGVLPTAMMDATKTLTFLLSAGKEYVCLMRVHKEVQEAKLRKTIMGFQNEITQLPPVKSRVKRVERQREIYYINIHEIDGQDVLFTVGCEAGTYIRKLCHDIGQKLKVGANMVELRRTKAGPFHEKDSVTLQDLRDAYHFWKQDNDEKLLRKFVLPVEFSISHLPKIWVTDSAVDAICHGAKLNMPGIVKLDSDIIANDTVALLSMKGELIAVGKAMLNSESIAEMDKGTAAILTRVVMSQGTYPKGW
jgi:H/ACA ribonucleoprotein complex subunit 4